MKKEILRKLVHASGLSLLPVLFWNRTAFVLIPFFLLFIYLLTEFFSRHNRVVPFFTWLVVHCKRPAEENRLAKGAVFLALTCIVGPFLFSAKALSVGLLQTFIADTFATGVGMTFGKRKIPYSKNKTWAGMTAFFLTATATGLFFLPWQTALFLGCVGAVIESLPLAEADNLTVPLAVALTASSLGV